MSDEEKYNHNLYVVDIAGVQKNSYYQIQHSSIFKGDPVLCAGNIYAKKGVITKIDNGSGHYKPKPSHLKKACEWIWLRTMGKKKGMPNDAEVWVWGWAKNNDLVIVHFHDFVEKCSKRSWSPTTTGSKPGHSASSSARMKKTIGLASNSTIPGASNPGGGACRIDIVEFF